MVDLVLSLRLFLQRIARNISICFPVNSLSIDMTQSKAQGRKKTDIDAAQLVSDSRISVEVRFIHRVSVWCAAQLSMPASIFSLP